MFAPTGAFRRRRLATPTLVAAIGVVLLDARAHAEPKAAARVGDEQAIRPFGFRATDEALADLRRRIAATQWPEQETVRDSSQGVPLAAMRKLARHWATDHDWRKAEAKLNAIPQFVTTIDGLEIHFIHVRSRHENALPLVITHGWPGSVLEQIKLIGPLTDPTAHGGKAEDAFHLDNITLYWLTNTGVSASRLYWEYKGGFFDAKGVSIPVAVTVFPGEQYQAPRSWTERAYPRLIYYNRANKGGHFAAWEQPALFAQELRAAFRSLR